MDLVGPIIDIVKFVGSPIVRYLKYQIKFNNHLEQFNVSKEGLSNRKREIESRLNIELHYGKVAKEEVQTWLNDVEKFLARQEVANEVNSWGCLSCCCRVKILEERAQEAKEIYDKGGSFTNECLVKDDPFVSAVELPIEELQGSGDVKAEILMSLMGDEVIKLGVWGMGGVGKTTIMMHVHNELLNKAKFKKVIWVTVSQTFDIYKLQEQIACSLNRKLEENQNTTNRAAVLSKMLEEQKPYLLILDDVWRRFKLTAVGIPEPFVSDGCKLVLTTRSQEVARTMDCKIIKVKTLSQKEALKLFIDKVGDIVLSDQRCIKGTLESTLKGIVDECDGLPLAIVTVASSLKGISEPRLWSAALNQLKDCKRNVACTDDNDDAFGVLKFSYDRLKSSQIQHCFLCCALYPEDHNIPIDDIIDYWIDEGLIDEMETIQAMKDEGLDRLKKLQDNCLLESSKYRFENGVRMHDLVRDMALQITRTSPRFMVEAGKALTKLHEKGEWTEDLEKVSLMRNKIEEIPSSILSSKCTMLTTLLLSHNNLSIISESVFENIPALKILDLSHNFRLRSLPSSISKLVNLTTLLLQWCPSLTEVPTFSEFGALKKLNLNWTNVEKVPKGLEMCTNLKYFSLMGNCDILDDAISLNLPKLQQLFVDERIALRGEVIGRLEKLEAFHGRFHTVHDWSNFLKCVCDQGDQLSRYSVAVGKYPHLSRPTLPGGSGPSFVGGYCPDIHGDRTVKFGGENTILPPSVDVLYIGRCDNVRSLNDFSSIKDATDLRGCEIAGCEGMECVFTSWINPLVQTLEQLNLCGLVKLEGLFDAEMNAMSPSPPPGTFSSLKSIHLFLCGKIKRLIPSWKLLGNLQSLERIDVQHCEELEEIIASDPEEGGDIIKELILPKLKYLSLRFLRALKSICGRRAVMVCDSLEVIWIKNCQCLRRIPLSLPLVDNAQPSPPPSLKAIGADSEEWWESLEWDHPNAKVVLQPMVHF
ncbi:hypothetical protein SLEP1_g41162 [Rubroshorea leprosula]|uniref:Uncharacterized protein n=1 Tax=Rubroshorea leprosula TaxID=152421 RepID=A0AAV5L5Z3_9ROSI|nr:hypothetical protein SLEP1_g41162 [Rubroshorea leprosula]